MDRTLVLTPDTGETAQRSGWVIEITQHSKSGEQAIWRRLYSTRELRDAFRPLRRGVVRTTRGVCERIMGLPDTVGIPRVVTNFHGVSNVVSFHIILEKDVVEAFATLLS
jgi:hypothetical protein